MAGISVPVIVHLWNLRRGKVLRIGSIALLTESSRRLAWSRRITQWWLLILRCLLLLFLALLLAHPYWSRRVVSGKGWVLTSGSAGPYFMLVDSLLKAGYERHELEDSGNYWVGFSRADKSAPAEMPFYVFTPGLASRFAGERPVTGRAVHWYSYAPVDSASRWIQAAWTHSGDSIQVLEGSSRSTGTSWQRRVVPGRGVEYEGIKVDTGVLRYRIYADGAYRADGKYVQAALRALRQMTGRPMEEGDGGWLFWLSAKPLPAITGYRYIWRYAQGKERVLKTWMSGIHLTKEITGATAGEAVWKDGYGRGVLTREGQVYTFYSRLDANWGDLVWSGRLPVLLQGLFGEERADRDRRLLDPRQVAPVETGAMAGSREAGSEVVSDLRPAVWVIVFLLFFLERIKAFADGKGKA